MWYFGPNHLVWDQILILASGGETRTIHSKKLSWPVKLPVQERPHCVIDRVVDLSRVSQRADPVWITGQLSFEFCQHHIHSLENWCLYCFGSSYFSFWNSKHRTVSSNLVEKSPSWHLWHRSLRSYYLNCAVGLILLKGSCERTFCYIMFLQKNCNRLKTILL